MKELLKLWAAIWVLGLAYLMACGVLDSVAERAQQCSWVHCS
jgi:hypothetical protein